MPQGDRAAETSTMLALRAIANMFGSQKGREVLQPAAKGLLDELTAKGDWEGAGKWAMPAATIGLK